ncbi:hypothetical protein F4678DRAFT_456742 [Xylaria arbuscula]|nr:hypothetical protein F4678DRAFT_456742 [Xylaria arbuscula]
MADKYDQPARELASSLPPLQNKFRSLESDNYESQLEAQTDLSNKTNTALTDLMSLAEVIGGDFDPASSPSTITITVTSLGTTWQVAEKAAEHCLDLVNSHSALVAQFHDAELGGWQDKANKLDTELKAELRGTKEALHTQEGALQTAKNAQATSQEALDTLRRKLYEERHKYDIADKVTWIWPPARLYLEAIKRIIEALSDNEAELERAVGIAERHQADVEQWGREEWEKAAQLSSLTQRQAALLEQGKSLMSECDALMSEVESAQEETSRIKTQRYDAWQLVARCVNRAENAGYALTKADYGTAILQVCEVALRDHTLRSQVASIVEHLARHDDSKGSIKNIKTDDHPDQGLLSWVQGLLRAPREAPISEESPLFHLNLLRSAAAEPDADIAKLSDEDKNKVRQLLRGLRAF